MALACDHRIAVDGAWFGFPEVRLGLHPGLGGTFRLPQLIDPIEAMTMMLTGKSAHTKKAKAPGIVECLCQGVVADADTLDAAMIFATGFAPFRGGPIHHARQRGAKEIAERLTVLASRYGPRFAPDKGWNSLD